MKYKAKKGMVQDSIFELQTRPHNLDGWTRLMAKA